MNTNNVTISTLLDLLIYDSQKIVNGESQLISVLPGWIAKTGSQQLKTALDKYLNKIKSRIDKIEQFFILEKIFPLTTANREMNALIEETEIKLKDCTDSEVMDACILASVQRINHYKICVYGTVAAFAEVLNMDSTVSLFREAEIKEKQIDDLLSQLAKLEINPKAKMPLINY